MSTILPLEVVFGQSTWGLAIDYDQFKRAFDPSPLFGVKAYTLGIDPYTERLEFFVSYRLESNTVYGTPIIERLPHAEGLLGDRWDEIDVFLKSYNAVAHSYPNRIYEPLYIVDVYSPDGEVPIDTWGPEVVTGYRFIHPYVENEDGTFDRPFNLSDVTAPQEEVFLTGECGSGGGSERPESGLLYPRKV